MVIAGRLTVVAENPQLIGQFVVVGRDHAPISKPAQVLRGVEAETSDPAQRPGGPARMGRPDRLGNIFDQWQSVRLGQVSE